MALHEPDRRKADGAGAKQSGSVLLGSRGSAGLRYDTRSPMESSMSKSPGNDEKELIIRAKCGDRTPLDRLLKKHQGRCYGWLRAHTSCDEDAEDILQEVLIRVANGIRTFDETRPFHPWLMKIAWNELRRKQSSSLLVRKIPDTVDGPGWSDTVREVQDDLGHGRRIRLTVHPAASAGARDVAENALNCFVADLDSWTDITRPISGDPAAGYSMDIVSRKGDRVEVRYKPPSDENSGPEPFEIPDEDPGVELFRKAVVDSRLLEVACTHGGPAWHILAFGFVKLLLYKPLEIAADYAAAALRAIEQDFEDELVSKSGLMRFEIENETAALRKQTQGDAGGHLLQEFLSDNPTANISDWVYTVKRRVFDAFSGQMGTLIHSR
jgi:RNA polymerase sigma factor (sigma-70 family)